MEELLIVIPLCILALIVISGGYVYMFLSVMRADPRESEFRKKIGQDDSLIPHTYK